MVNHYNPYNHQPHVRVKQLTQLLPGPAWDGCEAKIDRLMNFDLEALVDDDQ